MQVAYFNAFPHLWEAALLASMCRGKSIKDMPQSRE